MKPIHAKPSLYAFYFEVLKEIALKYGYNLVLHGSLNRDLDLIAIPWGEIVGDCENMIDEFAMALGGNVMAEEKDRRYGIKPHGRIVYVININRDFEMTWEGFKSEIKEYSDPQYYLDISVTPIK